MKALLSLALAALLFSFHPVAHAEDAGPKVNYTYSGTVVRVLDGNSVMIDVDLGFGVWMHHQVFKLQGIKAPSTEGTEKAAGLKWKSKVQEILPAGLELIVKSTKDKSPSGVSTYYAMLWKDGVDLNDQIEKAMSGDTTAIEKQ